MVREASLWWRAYRKNVISCLYTQSRNKKKELGLSGLWLWIFKPHFSTRGKIESKYERSSVYRAGAFEMWWWNGSRIDENLKQRWLQLFSTFRHQRYAWDLFSLSCKFSSHLLPSWAFLCLWWNTAGLPAYLQMLFVNIGFTFQFVNAVIDVTEREKFRIAYSDSMNNVKKVHNNFKVSCEKKTFDETGLPLCPKI